MKNKQTKKWITGLLGVIIAFLGLVFGQNIVIQDQEETLSQNTLEQVSYGEAYQEAEDVAAYLSKYAELPPNYITKDQAHDLGWDAEKGNLHEVAPGASIGGDYFGNFEELLPEKPGRDYYEADVNYEGGFRGKERLVYSNDGLIFYTGDHYQSFTQIE